MQAPPPASLYRNPEISQAYRLEKLDPLAYGPIDDTLATSNANEIYSRLGMKPRSVLAATLKPVCVFMSRLGSTQPLVVSKRKFPFAHSFMVIPAGQEKTVYISFKERIHPDREKTLAVPYLRIKGAARVVFGPDGKVKKVTDIVKIFAHFAKDAKDPKNQMGYQMLLRQISIMQDLPEKYYPHNYGFFEYEGAKSWMIAICQERASWDLHTLYDETAQFNFLSPQERLKIARHCVEQVENMHKKGYAHRDIKLANFLVFPNSEIKLSDFGHSVKLADIACQSPCGTSTWQAPEIVYHEEDPKSPIKIGKECDIWSLGLLLHALAGEAHPNMLLYHEINILDEEIKKLDEQKASHEDKSKLLKQKALKLEKWKRRVRNSGTPPKVIRTLKGLSLSMLQHDPEQRRALGRVKETLKDLEEAATQP